MKPIGPLMREHRLIERMIALLNGELIRIIETNRVGIDFIKVAVDFIRTYADRTHHGKEEDILFRELAKKPLSQEHILARKMVISLVNAKENYKKGDVESLKDIVSGIKRLVEFYPAHIDKEDKHFFYPPLDYLSKQEQDDMLQEFWDFDRKLIHEKYQGIVVKLEQETA